MAVILLAPTLTLFASRTIAHSAPMVQRVPHVHHSVSAPRARSLVPTWLRHEIRRGASSVQPFDPSPKPAPAAESDSADDGIAAARFAAWAGLAPFVAGAISSIYLPTLGHWGLEWSHYLMWVQMSYGACVLSFLGAVHWGLALTPTGEARRARILWSVLPSLWATVAQAVPPLYGAPLLIIGFVSALAADSRAAKAGLLPAWYLHMRIPITLGVVLSLGTSFVKLL